jgi:O-antigen/teichoic acid export membrane protein
MLILVAWAGLTLSAGIAVFAPPLIPIIFGNGWEVAAALAGPLAIAGGLQIVSTLLASAIEALGRFRWIWSTDIILILLQLSAVALIFVYRDIFIAVVALITTNILRHAWQIWLAGRDGYLNVPRLLTQYVAATLFAAFTGVIAWVALRVGVAAIADPWFWLLDFGLFGLALLALVKWRERIPAVALARKYGFLRG